MSDTVEAVTPLWTEDGIWNLASSISGLSDNRARFRRVQEILGYGNSKHIAARQQDAAKIADLLRRIAEANERNETMGQRIAELEAERDALAQADAWEPLADGKYDGIGIMENGELLTIGTWDELGQKEELGTWLPPDRRLCRRVRSEEQP